MLFILTACYHYDFNFVTRFSVLAKRGKSTVLAIP